MKTKTVFISLGVALAFFLISSKKAFANVLKNQQLRDCDGFGCGHFGASRGDREHQGLDISATPGETVFSPITGTVTRFPFPYGSNLRYKGIEIKNEAYIVKIFYMEASVSAGESISQGQPIGIAQNIASKYGNTMINHIHIEVRETQTNLLIDPTKLF